MTLLTVERMKLLSTRSPWWCMALAVALTVGLTTILGALTPTKDQYDVTPSAVQFFYTFGLVVMMVMAALAITTEYRFGTIRATFLAVPDRTRILLAKTVVVALFAGLIGEIAAVASWGIAYLLMSDAPLGIDTSQEFRNTFGVGLVYLVSAVMAVAIGLLLRHTAAALAVIFVWLFLLENLLPAIPRIGDDIQHWLPFTAGNNFLVEGQPITDDGPPVVEGMPFGPIGSLLYYAAVAGGLMVVALLLARRRDA